MTVIPNNLLGGYCCPDIIRRVTVLMMGFDLFSYGNGFQGGTNTSASGMYDTSTTDLMGTFKGLRQYYRFGMYSASLSALSHPSSS